MSGSEKPQRGPDTNATAPRTRFTKRISYSVWGRRLALKPTPWRRDPSKRS